MAKQVLLVHGGAGNGMSAQDPSMVEAQKAVLMTVLLAGQCVLQAWRLKP